jgi:hypothetical protein
MCNRKWRVWYERTENRFHCFGQCFYQHHLELCREANVGLIYAPLLQLRRSSRFVRESACGEREGMEFNGKICA